MRADIIGHARINCVGKSQSCMVSGNLDVLRLLLDYGATAFSNRKFSGQKLFQQPSWGPASIRPASIRPGTAPAGPGLGNFSFALLGPHRGFLNLTECAHVHEFKKLLTEFTVYLKIAS